MPRKKVSKKSSVTREFKVSSSANKQIDMILYEIRDLRKEVSELKSYVDKSKGTVAILVFMATIVATVVGAWNYLVK